MTGPPRPAARRRRLLPAVLLLGVVLALASLAGGPPAGAHAALVATTPGDGDRLDRGPTEVVLTFSESVSAGPGAVRVLGADGGRVDRGGVNVQGETVVVPLEGGLADGTYIVAWRVVSADSHPINGAFTFGVGEAAATLDPGVVDALVGTGGEGPWRVGATVARLLGYGGTLVATGLVLFLATVHDRGPERARLRRLVRVAAAVGAAGLVLEVPARAALATGLGPDSLTAPGVAGQVLGDNVGPALAVALLALLFVAIDAGRDRVVAGAGVVAPALAFAVAGHTATASPVAVAVVGDATHVAAASVWAGGLVGLLVVVVGRARAGRPMAAVVARFSGVAGLALAGVAAGGLALGWTQVGGLDALVGTPYGQVLLAKVALVGVVAALGGWNRYRVVPVLEARLAAGADGGPDPDADGRGDDGGSGVATLAPPAAPIRDLRRTLVAEVAVLAVVVALTAALVDITPARSSVAGPWGERAALGDGQVDLSLESTRAGRTTIHVYTFDADGRPWPMDEALRLRFSLPAAGITDLERRPAPTGPGHWTLTGDDLAIAGTWTIEVVARTSLYEEQDATFEVPIVG